ncbi:tRNA pseudouridine(55) synthase TruB [Lottiidibacillus patelloidae]|uniref:tRNA pseudouridine synthase B n=1 Tax=Lottiidibacillus patelloidae TaxID=2670334 RepID=A0A263BY19_9BACI|nr:tRNA pseudouridine(55) synthase TruB [Lottiidibacillus patelloidae]OZM58615.1 tRNA pseudouridine(55) synthase TruB [Lottiidibacillus patelloidae]
MEQYNGVLPLHKPRGMTSHDCVAIIRRMLKTRKVGHTGTLDPEVNGVLPICIGKATKIVQYVTDFPKEYEAEISLGKSTTTEDQTGETVEEVAVTNSFTKEEINAVLQKFTGEITQIPPMYSAVKVNGRKLYEYARAGETVERPERTIKIHNIELLDNTEIFSGNPLTFSIRVACSKGTYIRTLATDIGKALGYPAHMSSLVRTASGPFTLEDTFTFEQLEELLKEDNHGFLVSVEEALKHFPKWVVNDKLALKISNGAVLEITEDLPEKFVVYDESGRCLAIYQKHPTKTGLIKPEKVFS